MLPRSLLFAKYLGPKASCPSNNFNPFITLGSKFLIRHLNILARKQLGGDYKSFVVNRQLNLRYAYFNKVFYSTKDPKNNAKILDSDKTENENKINDLSVDKSKELETLKNVILAHPNKVITSDVDLVKQVEITTNGKKLIAEARIGPDSSITSITFKKEEVTKPLVEELPKVPKRVRVDLTATSLERNFITPARAMSDFLLKPSDLEALPKIKRRSPYELEPPITVFWRRDVEAKAYEIWGSRENLKKELLRKEIDRRRYQQNVFTVKRRLRDYRREMGNSTIVQEAEAGLSGRSGKVVLTAVAINGSNFIFKLVAWLYTGSHSMFSECIHSLADTINQLILAYGIHKSGQIADPNHPYGYTNMRYVASLISGVGIFCVGTGLSYYHGFMGLINPQPVASFYWAYFILGGAIVSEGATLIMAINAIKKGAKEADLSFKEYVLRGSDPSVNVVLLEDMAAVGGVAVAACFMGMSSLTGNSQWDACGSLFVGTILGCVASFIILTNVGALVGRSIPQEQLDKINLDLESDVMIRAIHDVKGIDMGSNLVRYKAELDFDGRELTRSYLDKQDLNTMLDEIKKLVTINELEGFLLKHGENIVDMMGGEIDRIELKLRKRFPFVRHCDLEIL